MFDVRIQEPRTSNVEVGASYVQNVVSIMQDQGILTPIAAQRAQALLADDMPWIPIYVRLVWGVTRPEVRNLRLHPTGLHRLNTVTLEPGS